jgi:hypothetical protein
MLEICCTLHSSIVTPTHNSLKPGDIVFIRWQGSIQFQLIEIVEGVDFPHWKCKSMQIGSDEVWMVPQIHISKQNIAFLVGEHNRKQLSLETQ